MGRKQSNSRILVFFPEQGRRWESAKDPPSLTCLLEKVQASASYPSIILCETSRGFSFFSLYFTGCIYSALPMNSWTTKSFPQFIFLWIIKRGASNLAVLCFIFIMLTAFIMLLFSPEDNSTDHYFLGAHRVMYTRRQRQIHTWRTN